MTDTNETGTYATDFDEWMVDTFAEVGPFTVLFVLVEIGETTVEPRRAAFLHVTGDEVRWTIMEGLLDSASVAWTGVVFYRAGQEGLVTEGEARRRLAALLAKMHTDRSIIREGEFFNRDGLRLSLEEIRRH